MDAVPSPPPSSSLSTMNGGAPGGRDFGLALPRLPNELDIRAVSPRRPSREDARYPTQGVRLSSPASSMYPYSCPEVPSRLTMSHSFRNVAELDVCLLTARASVPELAPLRTTHPSYSGSVYSSPASARPLDSDAYHSYPNEHEYSNPHAHYPAQGYAAPYTTPAQQTHVSQGYSHHQPPNPSVYPPPMPSPPSGQTTVPSTPVGATPYASQFQIQLPPPPPHLGQYSTNGPARTSSASTSASLPNIAPYPYYGGTSGVRASVACDACRKRKVKCSVLMSQQQNYQRSNSASGVVMNDPYAPPSTLSPSEERRGSIMLQEPPPKVCVRCARLGINCTWKDDREREATKKPSSSALSSAAASGRAASKARKEKDSSASSSAAATKVHEGQMTFDSGSYAPHSSGAPSSQQQSYGYPHPISPSASTSTSTSGSHTGMSVSTSSISGNSTSTVATSPSPPGSGGPVGNGYFVVGKSSVNDIPLLLLFCLSVVGRIAPALLEPFAARIGSERALVGGPDISRLSVGCVLTGISTLFTCSSLEFDLSELALRPSLLGFFVCRFSV